MMINAYCACVVKTKSDLTTVISSYCPKHTVETRLWQLENSLGQQNIIKHEKNTLPAAFDRKKS